MSNYLISNLILLPRRIKIAIVICIDIVSCITSVLIALYLRLGNWSFLYTFDFDYKTPILISIFFVIPIFIRIGMYRAIFRYVGPPVFSTINVGLLVYSFIFITIFTIIGISGIPRTIGLLQPILLFLIVVSTRFTIRYLLRGSYSGDMKGEFIPNILIYGIGESARQLSEVLLHSKTINVVGFLTEDILSVSRVINGLNIYHLSNLDELITKKGISDIVLALSSIESSRRKEILKYFSNYNVAIRTIPSLNDLIRGRVNNVDLCDVDIEDLIDRDIVNEYNIVVSKAIKDKIVLVTGAGGSIGSEICRQIIIYLPKKLILLELNEFFLFQLYSEFKSFIKENQVYKDVEVIPILASVQDKIRLQYIMNLWSPEIVYHAAAYKHVEIVENNISEGVLNNIFGTINVAELAIVNGVKNFVFISTDKAVRPTSVMGLTKRVSEIAIQAMAAQKNSLTKFAIVRFGNVLDSSGSVVQIFRNQIKKGGPITLTHQDMTRYFMTIPEAAQLVIHAGAMDSSSGGEVFLLHMGKPVRIIDLAIRMVKLMGLTIKDEFNPKGDIQIKITGISPGEKLHEELLIGSNHFETEHPQIMKEIENFVDKELFSEKLNLLVSAINNNNTFSIIQILKSIVPEYEPSSKVIDLLGNRPLEPKG